ncbi:MAG: hypothetical protein ISR26_06270 [Porticoccaceae bacterium]|nr:hypothetical protein [Porticoccaceae bacterium]
MTRQLITFSLLALLSACTSLPPESNREVEVSPRQGEEVKQICFASSINGWREVDGERSSVILTKGVSEEYKLDLSGICDLTYAFNSIATRTRGSSCLTRGDDIIFNDGLSGINRCMIKKIYTWNPAEEADADNNEPTE